MFPTCPISHGSYKSYKSYKSHGTHGTHGPNIPWVHASSPGSPADKPADCGFQDGFENRRFAVGQRNDHLANGFVRGVLA